MSDNHFFKDPLLYRAGVFLMGGGNVSAAQAARIFNEKLIPLFRTPHQFAQEPAEFLPVNEFSSPIWNVRQTLSETEQLAAFARSHSDSAILLLGADELGAFPMSGLDDWAQTKKEQVNLLYWNERRLAEVIRYPDEDSLDETRLRMVGQSWILAAEVENWSAHDWRKFSMERYASGGWVKFAWGVMGGLPGKEDELPQFEMFFEKKHQKKFEKFLFEGDMGAFLAAFFKVSQFVRHRFHKTQSRLRSQAAIIEQWRERSIFDAPEPPETARDAAKALPARLGMLEKTIRSGNKILLGYSTSISDLAEYIHTVEINSAIIEQIFSKNRGKISPFSAYHFWHREVVLFRRQMTVEQKYHDIIYNHLRGHFEAMRVISEVKKSHFEYLLALTAIIFGAIVGLGQILTSVNDHFWKTVTIVIIISLIVTSFVLAAVLSVERFRSAD